MRFNRDEAGSMGIRKDEVVSVPEKEEDSLLLEDEGIGRET